MVEEYKYKIIRNNFNYKGRSHHLPGEILVSKYFGLKGLKEGFLEKIEFEDYGDESIITQQYLNETISDFNKKNPYFNDEKGILIFDGKKIDEQINIIDKNHVRIFFINCEFPNGLIIEKSIMESITFENCFLKFVEISDTSIKKIEFRFYNRIDWITIQDCPNLGEFIIDTSNKINSLKLWYNSFENIINISNNVNMRLGGVNYFIKNVSFVGNTFDKRVKINGNNFSNFSLSGNTFKNIVSFLNNNFDVKLDFFNNNFQDRLKISKLDGHPEKVKSGEKLEKEINEKYKIPESAKFKPNQIKFLSFNSNKINSFRLGYQKIQKLIIDNLENHNDSSEINMGDLIISDELTISNLRNYKKMRLYRINYDNVAKKDSLLNINNSTFGSAEFQEVNFGGFDNVKMYSSNLIGIETIDVIWPKSIKNDNLEQTRNTYRMLKHSLLKQEDRIQALNFFSKEMIIYYEQLNQKKKWSNLQERMILGFNKNTNNFGLDWFTPIILMFLVNGFFLLVYNLINPIGYFPNIMFTYDLTNIKGFGLYFSDIIKSFYFISGIDLIIKNPNNLTLTFEVIRKVFISILLYQTIIAFRKYTRKI
jgi:hypothetical protein